MTSKISIVFSLLITFLSFPQNDIKIISSDKSSIVVEYTPVFTDTLVQKINNKNYLQIILQNGYIPNVEEWGVPAVPARNISLGVPSEFGNTVQILNSSFNEIEGALAPNPKIVKEKNLDTYSYEISPDYNKYQSADELITFGEFGILRGIPVHSFAIHPVKFYPDQNMIRLYNKIIFRINFSAAQKINPGFSDNFIKDVILNYDVARQWGKERVNKLNKVTSSVLTSGKWVKFTAPEEGIYKITYSMLPEYGIDPGVDPRTIKIYNNSGKVLTESVTDNYPKDLIENAIMVIGEEDGVFNEGDYVLFYGRGTNFWDYDTLSGEIRRFFSSYSKDNFYWITSGGSNGKRIQNKPSLNQTQKYTQTSAQGFAHWDEDKLNFGKTGRIYVGDIFNSSSKSMTYTNMLNGLITSVPIEYNFRFVNASNVTFNLQVFENSHRIFSRNLSGHSSVDAYDIGRQYNEKVVYNNPSLPENRSVLKFEISSSSVAQVGYLDYFEIFYQKELRAFNDNLLVFSKDTSAVIEYTFSGFSATQPPIKVFDVTDFANVKIITDYLMHSGGQCRFQALEEEGNVSKYFAVGNDNFKTPANPVEVPNQNLSGISPGAKYIIITHKDLLEQANRLKNYRESGSLVNISTLVVDVEQIFNEFSGGMLDVGAIRNFIKYAYDTWTVKPEYVLLLGNGTYDYKNLEGANNNLVPTYQVPLFKSRGISLNFIDSNPLDDFYVRVDGNDLVLDLAVGRIHARNPEEAGNVIDKIIEYEKNPDKGSWNQLITLVADDALTTETKRETEHNIQSEDLAQSRIPASFNLKKIYLAAYPTVITGAGRTKPSVNNEIVNTINNGTIVINYVGHGNEEVWAHERVFDYSSISQLNNDKYFFLTAPTCTYGYYDLPSVESGAEILLMRKGSGAIGAFASSRPVYSARNHAINMNFYGNIFNSTRDTLNLPVTLGKAYFKTKSSFFNDNDIKFSLFGDPALRLAFPQYSATIDSVNGSSLSSPVQLSALSSSTVKGSILKPDGTHWSDFTGEGILSVFDSERNTVIREEVDTSTTNLYSIKYQGGLIFKGIISVNNGNFNANFVVPKDISYNNQKGKVVIYFYNNNSDGIGYTNNVVIGGTDSSITDDGKGPEINIHFDNENYNGNYLINPNSTLIIKLSDETGINTTGTGVGHRLEGILNDNESEPIDFTQYFTGDRDAGGKSGKVEYSFNNLKPGDYKIEVKAWDVFNNFSTEYAYFSVVDGNDLVIRDIYNYPNPFSNNTTFTFQHNLDRILDIQIKVYTIAGRLIKEIDKRNVNDGFVRVDWDGRDEDGSQISNGTYLYKIIVKTADGEFSKSVLGKMAVIR